MPSWTTSISRYHRKIFWRIECGEVNGRRTLYWSGICYTTKKSPTLWSPDSRKRRCEMDRGFISEIRADTLSLKRWKAAWSYGKGIHSRKTWGRKTTAITPLPYGSLIADDTRMDTIKFIILFSNLPTRSRFFDVPEKSNFCIIDSS